MSPRPAQSQPAPPSRLEETFAARVRGRPEIDVDLAADLRALGLSPRPEVLRLMPASTVEAAFLAKARPLDPTSDAHAALVASRDRVLAELVRRAG